MASVLVIDDSDEGNDVIHGAVQVVDDSDDDNDYGTVQVVDSDDSKDGDVVCGRLSECARRPAAPIAEAPLPKRRRREDGGCMGVALAVPTKTGARPDDSVLLEMDPATRALALMLWDEERVNG